MHAVVERKRPEIEALCREFGVRRLDVFGSAVGEDFDVDSSDVDVLGLEQVLGRAVDVVSATSIRNPYFRDRVMRTREPLYAA